MAVNYDKLWGLLSERGMMKTELIKEAKISTNAMAKLGRKELFKSMHSWLEVQKVS